MIRLLFHVGLFILLGCKHQEARRPVAQTQTDRFEKSIERNKQRYADEVKAIQSIIDDLPNSTFKPSESGFWYSVIYNPKKNNYHPQFGDNINFDLSISYLNGLLIYPEQSTANQSYVMDQEALFKGLREGLKLMTEGQKVEFLIPSQLAYGYYGDGDLIGPNVPLRCTVLLKSITQNKN
jgi:gliding motility-associated peptidyl-prolyl isomerase